MSDLPALLLFHTNMALAAGFYFNKNWHYI
jgi:hypothetical protein